MNNQRERAARAALSLAASLGATAFCHWQNNGLTVSDCAFESPRLPRAFDGLRVVHLSDLHNKTFGRGQRKLLAVIRARNPGLIVVTGDCIDKRRTTPDSTGPALELLRGAAEIAPTFYVAGNHEEYCGFYPRFRAQAQATGAHNLDWFGAELHRQGETIRLIGLGDPNFLRTSSDRRGLVEYERRLWALAERGEGFTLLLAHRPELHRLYAQAGVDLAFCGHAHGGQLRLPVVGPVIAPGQGLFPRYTGGLVRHGGRGTVISRGLGNSLFPQRLGNRPQVVTVTLRRDLSTMPTEEC